jgi:hypothetical protein
LPLEPYEISTVLSSFAGMFVFLSPLMGVFLGSSSGGFDMKAFAATRPLSDSALAAAVLRSAAVGVVGAAIVWLAATMATLAVWVPADWQALRGTWNEGLVGFHRSYGERALMHLLMYWTAVGLGVSLALSRQWFVCWGGVGSVALLLGFGISLDRLPRGAATALLILALAVCLGGTVAAFVAARRRSLMSRRMLFACLAGYLALLVYFYATTPLAEEPIINHIPIVCLTALPFAPLAAAPLALSWNRHR